MSSGQGCLCQRWSLLLLLFFILSNGAFAAQFRILGGVTADRDEAPYLAALLQQAKSLRVGDLTLIAQSFSDTPEQTFDAPLSYCGYGFEPCEDAQGTVCLIARGTITFEEKVASCAEGGGIGAIIYNYLPQVFLGAVGVDQPLPVLAVSSWTGQQLLGHVGESVSFGYNDRVENSAFFCGGSYLGDNWVLTAAHCVADRRSADMQVALGTGDYRDGRAIYQVQSIHSHQDFVPFAISLGRDVALLKLVGVPETLEGIPLVDLPSQLTAVSAADTVVAFGRGEQNVVAAGGVAGSGSMTYRAFTTPMQLIDRASCQRAMAGDVIEGDMICAGGVPAVGTCFGDSGGPLIWSHEGQKQLIGVISWGVGCGLADRYDVFASVASYKTSFLDLMQGRTDVLSGVELAADTRQDLLLADTETEELAGVGAAGLWLGLIVLAGRVLRGEAVYVKAKLRAKPSTSRCIAPQEVGSRCLGECQKQSLLQRVGYHVSAAR